MSTALLQLSLCVVTVIQMASAQNTCPCKEVFSQLQRNIVKLNIPQLHKANSQVLAAISQLQNNNSELVAAVSQLDTDMSLLRDTNSQLVTAISQLQNSNSELHNNNSELVTAMSQLRETSSQLVTALSQLQNSNSELVTAVSQLKETNSQVVTAISQLQSNNSELVTAMSQLRETNSQLVTAISQNNNSELITAVSQLQTAMSQLQRTDSQLVTAISELQNNNSELVTAVSQLRETNSQLVTSMTRVRTDVTLVKATCNSQLQSNVAQVKAAVVRVPVTVRLVGGSSRYGRLEVYYNGRWGTVCDDYFTDTDATVACYSLGYGYIGRTLGNRYGAGTGPIWLDDLGCLGSEKHLFDCPHYGWSRHNCGHYEDVSITCDACPSGFTYRSSGGVRGCYKVVTHKREWSVAGLECRSFHKAAHLLIIRDWRKQSAIAGLIATISSSVCTVDSTRGAVFWTAGQRIEPSRGESPFVWRVTSTDTFSDTMSVMSYTSWLPGEPNNAVPPESCIFVGNRVSARWNDENCKRSHCFICELDVL